MNLEERLLFNMQKIKDRFVDDNSEAVSNCRKSLCHKNNVITKNVPLTRKLYRRVYRELYGNSVENIPCLIEQVSILLRCQRLCAVTESLLGAWMDLDD